MVERNQYGDLSEVKGETKMLYDFIYSTIATTILVIAYSLASYFS